MPTYHPLPPKSVAGDGYPQSPKHAIKMIESIRGGNRRRDVAPCAASALVYGERLAYAHKTTIHKRPRDRTRSGKSGIIISDLRVVNLCIDASNVGNNGIGSARKYRVVYG